ncbi:hypothetical protein RR48_00239 [Papilio machaon]|uniref:Uncharacterized protein n=1 Tax=Papilio machaon TaxID=76193 RepID=A0A0N1IED0_PAPMA|nr:hypothetical protein RR48_00239 [Papilio machaon]
MVESEETRTQSDCESSSSEDSAVVFVAPSPPADSVPPAPSQHPPLVKCTSETDIYVRQVSGFHKDFTPVEKYMNNVILQLHILTNEVAV